MIKTIFSLFLFQQILFFASNSFAAPLGIPQELTDKNMKIAFEVHAPWNILDGTGEQTTGKVALETDGTPDSLRADVLVKDLQYKAGLSVAGRLVAGWLRANPPTPAKFIISKSALSCKAETISAETPCKGTVEGQLNIWAKNYTIDVPVEMKSIAQGLLLTGAKEIKWGDYGFGDPDSTISNLKPVIMLNFSIELPPIEKSKL